ncbi:MAG: GNAT family N-acetyltransferase [Rubrivivax sp.]|nr:GNAT family N-acetyltransferase [Rubrivivax sp.]
MTGFSCVRGLENWSGDLRAFLNSNGRSGVFGTTGWLEVVAETFGARPADSFVCLVVQDGAGFRLCIPAVHDPATGRYDAWANFYTPLAEPALGVSAPDAQDWASLFKGLLRCPGDFSVVQFGPWSESMAKDPALLEAAKASGLSVLPYFRFVNHYLASNGDWPAYWASRSGALKNTVDRKRKRFMAAGGRLETVTGGAGLAAGIQAYADIYAASWKEPEPFPTFMPRMMSWAASHGRLRLGLAKMAGEPVAAQVWLVHEGQAAIYKLAYRQDAAAWSAGSLLTAHLIEDVMVQDGVAEVDYGMGDEPYKADWMSNRRERWGVLIANPRTALGMAEIARHRVGGWVKKLGALAS